VTTCKLRDQAKIEFLKQAFGIAPEDADEVGLG
jgi:hypothetical protein